MPSRQFLTSCLTFGLTLVAVSDAFAQQTSRSNSRSPQPRTQVEQAARTRWQPVRQAGSGSEATGAESGVRQAANQIPARGPVRRTQATGELPAPKALPQSNKNSGLGEVPLVDLGTDGYEVPTPPQRSIMQNGPTQMHQPMDGEVIYESQPYTGDVVSDNYGGEPMACDSMGCSCDSGCDSAGSCGGACGCGACQQGHFGGKAWRPCLTICFPQDGWVSLDYLNWRQKGMNLPALVTTSNPSTTPQTDAGVLTRNSTTVLFGDERVMDDGLNGLRLNFGFWLDRCHKWAIAADYFDLEGDSVSFSRTSTGAVGSQILARPFFNVGNVNPGEDSQLVAYPNVLRGTVAVNATSDLVGAGFHLRYQTNCQDGCGHDLLCGGCANIHSRTHALLGYRYMQLDDSVGITEDLVSLLPAPDDGDFLIRDDFATSNTFNGIDLGMHHNRRRGRWSLDLLAKMALGNTRQVVNINGSTRLDGTAQLPAGGLLAQQSNMGRHERDRFTVINEIGATVGYHITRNFNLRAGYTFAYWSNVARAGDQIDLDVNPDFLPPATGTITSSRRPRFEFNETDYYVHGVNLGGEFTW